MYAEVRCLHWLWSCSPRWQHMLSQGFVCRIDNFRPECHQGRPCKIHSAKPELRSPRRSNRWRMWETFAFQHHRKRSECAVRHDTIGRHSKNLSGTHSAVLRHQQSIAYHLRLPWKWWYSDTYPGSDQIQRREHESIRYRRIRQWNRQRAIGLRVQSGLWFYCLYRPPLNQQSDPGQRLPQAAGP